MVRHYRERASLTQTELGDLVGKSLETIGRIERGATSPSLTLIEKLSDALKVDARDLMGVGVYAAKTKRNDPLGRLVEKLAALSDDEVERAEKVLAAAMGWTSRDKGA